MGKTPSGQKRNKKPENDLGFGNAVFGETRLVNADGSLNVIRKGVPLLRSFHIYNFLITSSWPKFLGLVTLLFFTVNLIFALLYWLIGIENIGANPGLEPFEQFSQAFHFSVQTITTVGYGHLYPVNWSASLIAAIESLAGLLCFAIATGLVYSRFVKPNIKLRFSQNILLAPFKDGKALMFRFINERKSQLIEVNANCVVSFEEGDTRKFAPLKLEINKISMLVLNWTVVHPVNEESPFFGLSEDEIKAKKPEIIIMISGFEETFGQTVYYRTSYDWNQWVHGAKFNPITEYRSGFKAPILNVDLLDDYRIL